MLTFLYFLCIVWEEMLGSTKIKVVEVQLSTKIKVVEVQFATKVKVEQIELSLSRVCAFCALNNIFDACLSTQYISCHNYTD